MIRKVLLSVAILVGVLGFTAGAANAQDGLSGIIDTVIGGLLGGGDDSSSADYTPPGDVLSGGETQDPGGSGAGLAATGSNAMPMVIAGVSAVALGGALLVTTRRRRTA